MKKVFVGAVCLCLLLVAANARAMTIIDVVLDYNFNSARHDPGEFTGGATFWEQVGVFTFTPIQGKVLSATLSGVYGNSVSSTTAGHNLYLDPLFGDPEYIPGSGTYVGTNPYAEDGPAPWSFALTDFSDLMDGSAAFWVEQFTEYYVRLGKPTTLHIEAVPVPAAVWLLGSGLLGLVGLRRKFKS